MANSLEGLRELGELRPGSAFGRLDGVAGAVDPTALDYLKVRGTTRPDGRQGRPLSERPA